MGLRKEKKDWDGVRKEGGVGRGKFPGDNDRRQKGENNKQNPADCCNRGLVMKGSKSKGDCGAGSMPP